MFQVFQLLFILFALLAMSQVVRRKKEGLLSTLGLFFWIIVWIAAIGAVLYPDSTQFVADTFGIGRGTDFVVYISLAAMFFALFRLHIKIESMQRDLTKVVRCDSLKDS